MMMAARNNMLRAHVISNTRHKTLSYSCCLHDRDIGGLLTAAATAPRLAYCYLLIYYN